MHPIKWKSTDICCARRSLGFGHASDRCGEEAVWSFAKVQVQGIMIMTKLAAVSKIAAYAPCLMTPVLCAGMSDDPCSQCQAVGPTASQRNQLGVTQPAARRPSSAVREGRRADERRCTSWCVFCAVAWNTIVAVVNSDDGDPLRPEEASHALLLLSSSQCLLLQQGRRSLLWRPSLSSKAVCLVTSPGM